MVHDCDAESPNLAVQRNHAAAVHVRSACWFSDLTAVSQRCKILARPTSMKAEMAVFKVAARKGAVRSSLQLLADDTANVCQS